jgi:two-component system LytT family response regulator
MIRSVIIEDEAKSQKLLENLLHSYCPDVEVISMADSVDSGIQAINEHKPDLVFLDIILKDRDAFELLAKLDKTSFEIIFTTAHHEYAIKAIRVSALDYLLKPIDVNDLERAVDRVKRKIENDLERAVDRVKRKIESQESGRLNQPLVNFIENQRNVNLNSHKIGLPTLQGLNFVQIKEIILCKAEGNYTNIFMTADKILVTRTLKDFEELLADYNFLRIHRSYLINLDHIEKYDRAHQSAEGDGGCVTLKNNIHVPVSRDRRKGLLNFLSKPF